MITEGIKHTSHTTVTEERTAAQAGSGTLRVFATPYMAALMENAAMLLLAEQLGQDQTSVGTALNITHTAPTPVGLSVRAEAEVTHISENGRLIDFKVRAYDDAGLIGEGTHQRAIVDAARFMEKAERKLQGK